MIIYMLLRTFLSYFLLTIIGIFFIPPLFFIACLPDKYRYSNKFFFSALGIFYKLVCQATLCPVIIKGKENLPQEPSIITPNHQSTLDIPLVGSLCQGTAHVWLVLEFYSKVPVLGFFISRMFVPVDNKNPSKAARSLLKVYKFIQERKQHLIIFPEGGRFIDGDIHKFFEGFAVLAKKTGMPVVPVYMPNNRKIYPPGSFFVYPYPFIAIIGKPLIIGQEESEKEFTERVRQWFIEQAEDSSS